MIVESPFDSAHYELKIGRLEIATAAELSPALQTARTERFDVVFLRVSRANDELRHALAALEIAPLEELVTSTLSEQPPPSIPVTSDLTIEHHAGPLRSPSDIDAIAALTAGTITQSHLHADARLPRAQTRNVYAAWARNDVSGRAQRTIIARAGAEIVGYLTILCTATLAVIDLVAVSASWQGRGVGSALVDSFVTWVRGEGLVGRVGTQSDNRALALYERFGFVPSDRQLTYHLWLR